MGCENESEKAKKCFSVSRRAQSTAGNSQRRQARQGRQLRRTGTGCRGCAWVTPRAGSERGGGAATAAAWAGPCSHHLGATEGTRDSSSRSANTRMPPPCLQSSAVLTIAASPSPVGARVQGTPNASRLGRWSANFLRVAPRSLARGSCRQAAPEPPRGGGEERRGCCCGWELQPPRHTRDPTGSAASEVSALTLPLRWLNCLWVFPTVPAAPSFLPLLPNPGILKGAAR